MTDAGLYSLDDDNVVHFGFGNMSTSVSGPTEALQIAAYHLFQGRGTNSYDRGEGGGLQELIGKNMGSKQEIVTDATIAVSRAMANIRRTQADDKAADATIINLQLLDVQVLRESLEIAVTIRVDLLDGNSFQATFRVS